MTIEAKRQTLGWACACLAVGLFAAAWSPFEFAPMNRFSWRKGGAGITFRERSIGFEIPRPELNRVRTLDAFTIELWLEVVKERAEDCNQIVSVHSGRFPPAVVLCQLRKELLLRTPDARDERGFREVGVKVLDAGSRRFVTIAGDQQGTSFYLDGALIRYVSGFTLPRGAWEGRLVLGASADGVRTWTGSLLGLALYDRALSNAEVAENVPVRTAREFLRPARDIFRPATTVGLAALFQFEEGQGDVAVDRSPHRRRISFPFFFQPLQRRALRWPSPGEPNPAELKDAARNVLAFLPLGVVAWAYRRTTSAAESRLRAAVHAVGAAAAISLTIEIVQIWLPDRNSSALDLLCNTAGALLGVGAARFAPFLLIGRVSVGEQESAPTA